ncbi:MAG TPA: DUF167 domain-containing protein [Myxococcota bacterium]|nr:DUF167 domain-containing protein [Myxococcota bacterium]
MRPTVSAQGDRVLLELHVVPRAAKTAIAGVHDGRVKVSLAAPPVDGAANDALVAFIAKTLGRPKRDVELIRGEASRKKTLAIRGVTLAAVRALLEST